MLNFPLIMTFAELSELVQKLDLAFLETYCQFHIDEGAEDPVTQTLIECLDSVRFDPLMPPPSDLNCTLPKYLYDIGFRIFDDRIEISSENTLRLAHHIFCAVMTEYDEIEDDHPTWQLFNLGGDDDCDYFGSQPSIVTGYLINALTAD